MAAVLVVVVVVVVVAVACARAQAVCRVHVLYGFVPCMAHAVRHAVCPAAACVCVRCAAYRPCTTRRRRCYPPPRHGTR